MAIKIVIISENGDVLLQVTGEDCNLSDEEVIQKLKEQFEEFEKGDGTVN